MHQIKPALHYLLASGLDHRPQMPEMLLMAVFVGSKHKASNQSIFPLCSSVSAAVPLQREM